MSTGTLEKSANGAGTQIAQASKEVVYQFVPLGESDPITLTVSRVKQFLCTPTKSGKYPDNEQVVKYIMLCKAQGLNPWVNDAFLVGYDSQDGPTFSLITAHQAFLKRAEASKEYDGMESGVIVQREDSDPVYRPGDLVLRNETLIGGWAKVHRKDRKIPSDEALNLATFNTNRSRWKADPAGMIVKCAEASALRKAFPSNLAGLYCREEMDRVITTTATLVAEVAPGKTRSEALADQLQSRIAPPNSDSQEEPPNNGEESQVEPEAKTETPEQSELQRLITLVGTKTKIIEVKDIEARAKEFSEADAAILVKACMERQEQIKAFRGEKASGKLPGTE